MALGALKNSALYVHGRPEQPLDLSHLHEGTRQVLVLFPSEDARPLDDWVKEDPRPVTLVVPDGNWRQASRVPRRVPGLVEAKRVTLPAGPETRWGVRRETKDGGLATFEAIARALGILESPQVEEALLAFFDRMVAQTFETRGFDRQGVPLPKGETPASESERASSSTHPEPGA